MGKINKMTPEISKQNKEDTESTDKKKKLKRVKKSFQEVPNNLINESEVIEDPKTINVNNDIVKKHKKGKLKEGNQCYNESELKESSNCVSEGKIFEHRKKKKKNKKKTKHLTDLENENNEMEIQGELKEGNQCSNDSELKESSNCVAEGQNFEHSFKKKKNKKKTKDLTDPENENNEIEIQSELKEGNRCSNDSELKESSNCVTEGQNFEHSFKKKKNKKNTKNLIEPENGNKEIEIKTDMLIDNVDVYKVKKKDKNRKLKKSDLTKTHEKTEDNGDVLKHYESKKDSQFEEDSYDQNELDAYCDDVNEEDNQVFLNWVELLEAKLSSGNTGDSKKNKKSQIRADISEPKQKKKK